MKFRLEQEMTRHVARWMESQGLIVKAEFVTPWGVCDLVGVQFRKSQVQHRGKLRQNRPIGSILRSLILFDIPDEDTGRSISYSKLARRHGLLGEERLRRELEHLVERRFVFENRRGNFQKRNGWFPLHRRLVAVELKLHRFEDVCCQAKNHLALGAESIVALPSDLATRVGTGSRRLLLEQHGLGLLSVGGEGCRILIKPNMSVAAVNPAMQLYFVDKFWTSRATDNKA